MANVNFMPRESLLAWLELHLWTNGEVSFYNSEAYSVAKRIVEDMEIDGLAVGYGRMENHDG